MICHSQPRDPGVPSKSAPQTATQIAHDAADLQADYRLIVERKGSIKCQKKLGSVMIQVRGPPLSYVRAMSSISLNDAYHSCGADARHHSAGSPELGPVLLRSATGFLKHKIDTAFGCK